MEDKVRAWDIIDSYISNKAILFPRDTAASTRLARVLRAAEVSFLIVKAEEYDFLIVLDYPSTVTVKVPLEPEELEES